MLVPKLVTTLRGYTRRQLLQDTGAGVIVGIVALPLCIAFAISSGVSPDRGLYTAIVAGFLISALGGSRVQIGGPTGAFVVIVYGIVQKHGMDGLTVATIMAGVALVVMGVARLGAAIKFIPFPLITGFTSGIALLIFSQQVKDLLGLRMGAPAVDFFAKWGTYAHALSDFTPAAVLVSALTLGILIGWPHVSRTIPAPFVALVATTLLVRFAGLGVETIGTRFGAIPTALPAPALPHVTLALVRDLTGPALTIALLAGIESLLSAVVADGMIGGKHRSNMELVAQGVANVVTPLFGGIPATGAIARTATNIRAGGRTPVAGMVHAVTLLLIMLFFGRWAAYIPMATLAGILVMVSYHMSEWRTFRSELAAPRSDVAVLLSTFVLTVVVDLTVAIQVGMVLSALLFMRRMAEVTNVTALTRELGEDEGEEANPLIGRVPHGVAVYAIDGPFFFGAAEKFRETMGTVDVPPLVLVVQMRRVPAIDSTGIRALTSVVRRARGDGTRVVLVGVHAQPMAALARTGLLDEVGDENLAGSLDDALELARRHVEGTPSGTETSPAEIAGV
ncbi:MAG TPA: SulP family inorganic anion transporter [Longimicrobiaceae bacterium]|nr:SulP family inorganic anion transporter [Longimicrobiaceae bacterium]